MIRYILIFLVFNSCIAQRVAEYSTLESAMQNKNDVKILTLWGEKITDEIYGFKNLEMLMIHESDIDSITDDIASLKKLKTITVNLSGLRSVSPKLFSLKELKSVILRDNKLFHISLEKENVTIENLDISYNKLLNIDFITNFKKIRTFRCRGNDLTEIPNGIFTENLEQLFLMENKISTIPDGIEKARKLRRFILNKNRIAYLPKSFFQLENLSVIELAHNKFKLLNNDFRKLRSLKRLSLSYNEIEKIESEMLFENLEQLFLRGNKINKNDRTLIMSKNDKFKVSW